MNKEEYIKRYGIEAWEKMLQTSRDWKKEHLERARANSREWNQNHPDATKAKSREQTRKGGKYYKHLRQYQMNGIPHEKALVRQKHTRIWTPYKQIIAPDSQIHHEWLRETANYRGVALVEKDQHLHGYIDVIQILEGEITLLREEEVRSRGSVE